MASSKTIGGSTEIPKSTNKISKNGPIYQNAHRLHLANEKAKALSVVTSSMASASMTPSASMVSIATLSTPREITPNPENDLLVQSGPTVPPAKMESFQLPQMAA